MLLSRPVISIIPESDDIKKSQKEKQPVVFSSPGSEVTDKYNKLAEMLLGEPTGINTNWFSKLLK